MIKSKSNPKYLFLKKLLTKKGRFQAQAFLIEGENLITEAQRAKIPLQTINNQETADFCLAPSLLKSLSTLVTSTYQLALIKFQDYQKLRFATKRILWLDKVSDPGNFGTLLRSAVAFGYQQVYYYHFDAFAPKVLRAAQGAHFLLELKLIDEKSKIEHLLNLKKAGYTIYGTFLKGETKRLTNIIKKSKHLLILGNESQGVDQDLVKYFDTNLLIKVNFESLNVALAGAILMHHLSQEN